MDGSPYLISINVCLLLTKDDLIFEKEAAMKLREGSSYGQTA